MARKTLGERAGMFLTAVLLLVIGIHVCLLESENLRFRHPGRALQVGQAAPEGGFEGGNVEDRVLADDQPTKDSPEKTGSAPSTRPEKPSLLEVEAEVKKDDAFARHSAEESIKENPQNASALDLKVEVVSDDHVEKEPEEEQVVLLEMHPPECHCPSVLNGWHKPADPKCLQNCSSSFFQGGRPVVGIQNGPLVFPEQHDEF